MARSEFLIGDPNTTLLRLTKSLTSNRRVGRGRCNGDLGSARALACCRWRLANDFLSLNKRSISARRRNVHARARALPGKEEPPGDHARMKCSEKTTFVQLLILIKRRLVLGEELLFR